MPTIHRQNGYRFFFYSDEGDPLEPPHIHAVFGEKVAKFWLEPVELASSKRLMASEISALHTVVTTHRDLFSEAWHAYFNPRI